MNENARKWIEALRSGGYEQTTGRLRAADGYCCLGVACDLWAREQRAKEHQFEKPDWYLESSGDDEFVFYPNPTTDPSDTELPEQVREWLGLGSHSGSFTGGGLADREVYGDLFDLAGLNDAGMPFDEIADFIESEPQGLFEEKSDA